MFCSLNFIYFTTWPNKLHTPHHPCAALPYPTSPLLSNFSLFDFKLNVWKQGIICASYCQLGESTCHNIDWVMNWGGRCCFLCAINMTENSNFASVCTINIMVWNKTKKYKTQLALKAWICIWTEQCLVRGINWCFY